MYPLSQTARFAAVTHTAFARTPITEVAAYSRECEYEAVARGADFICLIPATDRLASTYSRIGYSKRIALCDAPEIHGDAIRPRSRDFYEFAIPESADVPLLTVDFGVMKPLTECADNQEFHFASYMGER